MIKNIPFYPDPTYRPPPKPVRIPMLGSSQSSGSTNIEPEIILILMKILHFKKA